MKPLLTTRLFIFALSSLATIGTLIVGGPESSFALDPLPRSPRVGSAQIPLGSYERIPIGKLLSNSTSYHLHETRIAGTVRTVQTQIKTRGCVGPYELTVISLQDESGVVDVLDQGACGRNTSTVRAPMLTAGDHVDLLVRVYGVTETNGIGSSLEVFVLWIERVQD